MGEQDREAGQSPPARPLALLPDATAGPVMAQHLGLAQLDARTLAQIAPMQVICPLFWAEGDAVQVAERLVALGWTGVLTVLAPDVPNRRMVQHEVQAVAGGIRVEVVAAL